jgi:hypothetical protein
VLEEGILQELKLSFEGMRKYKTQEIASTLSKWY